MTAVADLKALLDPVAGLTAVYRQAWVPDGAVLPYVSIVDPLSWAIALAGDGRTLARRETSQVDLWQDLTTEDDGLLGLVVAALDGSRGASGGPPFRVLDAVLVPGPEEDQAIVHHAITVTRGRVG